MVVCMECGRLLKGAESVARGYGPVCYRKKTPPKPKQQDFLSGYNPADDGEYSEPGKMELSDFIEMPEGGDDDD